MNNVFCHFYRELEVRGSQLNTILKMSIFNLWIGTWSRCAAAQHIIWHLFFLAWQRRKETNTHLTFTFTLLLAATPEWLQNPSAHLKSSAMAVSCTAPELQESSVRTLRWSLQADKQQVQAGTFTMMKHFCLSCCHLCFLWCCLSSNVGDTAWS